MHLGETIQSIIEIVGGLGVFGAGFGYLISQFKKGSNEQKKEVISSADQLTTFWKEQAEGYKAMAQSEKEAATIKDKDWNDKFNALATEVGQIKGQLLEKEKQAAQYLEILQNRDPSTLEFQKLMVNAVTEQSEVNKQIVMLLKDIYAMAKDEHDRDFKITTTVTKDTIAQQ